MKKILITGAGTGLGRGTVIGLARAGPGTRSSPPRRSGHR